MKKGRAPRKILAGVVLNEKFFWKRTMTDLGAKICKVIVCVSGGGRSGDDYVAHKSKWSNSRKIVSVHLNEAVPWHEMLTCNCSNPMQK